MFDVPMMLTRAVSTARGARLSAERAVPKVAVARSVATEIRSRSVRVMGTSLLAFVVLERPQ
jgi:hypothetical protein